jgi:hypothetical protein
LPNGPKMNSCAKQHFSDGVTTKTQRKYCYDRWIQKVRAIRVQQGIKSAARHVRSHPLRAHWDRYFLVY